MPNASNRAYGLTVLCPLRKKTGQDQSTSDLVRARLRGMPLDEDSPMAKVPNTYLCRFFVLDDVIYERYPARLEHLKSKYLVFVAELHVDPNAAPLDVYLRGMWNNAGDFVRAVFEHCIGFDAVEDGSSFIEFITKRQVETTFYFNGSTDESLAEQLKALYLKQELSKFAYANQGKSAADLQQAFKELVDRIAPSDLAGPTWKPGATSPDSAVHDPRNKAAQPTQRPA